MRTENTNRKKDPAPQKEGFFTRIFTKIDNSMKVKADEAAKNQCWRYAPLCASLSGGVRFERR